MGLFKEPSFEHKAFPFYLRRSTYIHLLLILLSLAGGKVALEIQERQKAANLELIQSSVRVDMVAMPTYTLNELKNVSSGIEEAKPEEKNETLETETKKETVEPEEKEVAVDPKKVDESPTFEDAQVKKRQDFLNKLKSLGNKKVESKGEQKADKGLNGDKTSALKNLVLSGNKLSKGVQIYGDGNGGDLTAFQAYALTLPSMIKNQWKLPSFLLNKNLQCRVRVWLNMKGEVTRTQIYQSSGDPEYDQRAIDAIKASSPFPPLKDEFSARAMNGDLLLGFPL